MIVEDPPTRHAASKELLARTLKHCSFTIPTKRERESEREMELRLPTYFGKQQQQR